MAIDPRKRAKQLARKAAKRKTRLAAHRQSGQSRESFAWIADWPLHESYVPNNLVEMGLGEVIISRKLGRQVAISLFLVDLGCLGVKDAFLRVVSAAEYELLLDRLHRERFVPVQPEYARKLVEGSVEYAADLGFQPHRDYHQATAIFGTLNTALCETAFQFGRDGKPFYCSGPSEGPARRQQIMDTLTRRCGAEGFHFMVGIGDSDSE